MPNYNPEQEFKKPHISRLPIIQFPEYNNPEPCDKFTISIPLFEGKIDSGQGQFTRERFKHVHVKGAIWTAMTIICNTDLLDNGVEIMFHVEDKVFDDAMEVFKQFEVPESLIHKRVLDFEERDIGQPFFGKKYMALLEECPTEAWFIIDSDMLFATSQNKIKIYEHLDENETLIYDPFDAQYNDENYHGYLLGICAAAGRTFDTEHPDYYQLDSECYNVFGFDPPPDKDENGIYWRAYAGTQMICLPENAEFTEFMRRFLDISYQDEFSFSAWATDKARDTKNIFDSGVVSLRHKIGIPFYNHCVDYFPRDESQDVNGYIPHLHTPDFGYQQPMTNVDEFFPTMLDDLTRFYTPDKTIELPVNMSETGGLIPYTDVSAVLAESSSDKEGNESWSHHYGLYYDLLLNTQYHKLGRPLRILEIGVSLFEGNGSFRAWADLDIVEFVCGVDINEYNGEYNEKMRFLQGNAYSQKSIQDILNDSGTFDIIIDDGSHEHDHQKYFAENFWQLLNPGGYLVIEDIWLPETQTQLAQELGFTVLDGWPMVPGNASVDRRWESIAIKHFPMIEKPVVTNTRISDVDIPLQMTFHCFPPPYAFVSKKYPNCAFNQKVLKFALMMLQLGHKVKIYTHPKSNIGIENQNLEIIPVISDSKCKEVYGDLDYNNYFQKYELGDGIHLQWTKNTIKRAVERIGKNDLILPFYGTGNQDACQGILEHCQQVGAHIIEPGIGYPDCMQDNRIYESSSKYHFDLGRRAAAWEVNRIEGVDLNYRKYEELYTNVYDHHSLIVPNYFDPIDFVCPDHNYGIDLPDEPYCLFLGRVIHTKGIHEAIKATKRAGVRLIVAGPDCEDLVKDFPEHVTYIGEVNVKERCVWMSHSLCLICFTHYPGPFEGVHVESWLASRPVITSNSGVFCETVVNGYNGYRVQWPEQISIAIKNIDKIDPENCYKSGMNYCLDNISLRYHYYFQGFLRLLNNAEWSEDFMTDLDWDRPYNKEYVEKEIASIQIAIEKEKKVLGRFV